MIKNHTGLTLDQRSRATRSESLKNPVDFLRKEIGDRSIPSNGFRLVGGAVGFISYDAVRYWEKIGDRTRDDLGYPEFKFGIFDDGLVYDHVEKQCLYYYQDIDRYDELCRVLSVPSNDDGLRYSCLTRNMTKRQFERMVTKAKAYVRSGDIFQVVLSKRYKFDYDGNLLNFYRALRKINPSPYMYFVKLDRHQVIGSSPEMLVRVEGHAVDTFPIAGTRRRGETKKKDEILARRLIRDRKERAEHVMLVDLARNDMGRVCDFGSVKVTDFLRVQKYSHVQHIVSRVSGRLRSDCDAYDAMEAVFPAGTVSGAPKVRAMEIIEELEPTRRGPYAGAVGYFSYNGNADFAITIRTLIADSRSAYIQSGAGIVADSKPTREWHETEHKARALLRALAGSGRTTR